VSHEDLAVTVVERAAHIQVLTPADYEAAAEFLKGATSLDRRIAEHYTPLKAAAHALHKDIVAAESKQRSPIQFAIAKVKGLMVAFQQRQRTAAGQAQTEAQQLADRATPPGAIAPQMQVAPEIPSVDGLSGRSAWRVIIDDEQLIPREYLVPNMVLLNATARRMKRDFAVPGCHVEEDPNLIVRE